MMAFFGPLVLGLYYVVLGLLALYGIHRLVLLARFWRSRPEGDVPPLAGAEWPHVTVQLPLYNEMFVGPRLLLAVARFDYPRDKLHIQVLDDSTDDTKKIMARVVEDLRERGVDVVLLHRRERHGFKAGALAAGLEQSDSELVGVFDADFVPRPDFLRRVVPHFTDPGIGMVQARWSHLNRGASLLTQVQAILLDGHFLIEHAARHQSRCFFNFNGTAGVWRRQAIDDAGGWTADTLTEDLDLSYRAQLAGWRFRYLANVEAPAELPEEIDAFKSQQHRWAKGSVQTMRRLLGRVLRADLPWRVKLEGFVHLTANLCYPLMIALGLLIFPAMYLRRGDGAWKLYAIDLPFFLMATVSILLFYLVSQREAGTGVWRQARFLPALMATGMGISVNNAGAVVSGFFQDGGVFHRTPKRGAEKRQHQYRLPRRLSFIIEGLLALYFLGCFAFASGLGMWHSLPFIYLFLQGYTHVFALSVLEHTSLPGAAWTARRKVTAQ